MNPLLGGGGAGRQRFPLPHGIGYPGRVSSASHRPPRGAAPLHSRVPALPCALALLLAVSAHADIGGRPSAVHAVTGARIVMAPDVEPIEGTIVLRDGRIEVVGADVDIPPDAVVHDRTGRTLYPGLVEPYLRLAATADSAAARDSAGTVHENPRVRSHVRAVESLPLAKELLEELRGAGFTVAFAAPGSGNLRGTGVIVSLTDDPADAVVVPDAAHVVSLERTESGYPGSLMGAIALVRQTFHDVAWHRDAWAAWTARPDESERPTENRSLRALEPALDGRLPVFFEAEDLRVHPRALAIAAEFALRPVIVSGGSDEYRRPDLVRSWLEEGRASLVLAVDYPRPPEWSDDDGAVAVELGDLVHWERAPTNPRVLESAGVRFAVTTQGLEKREHVLARLRTAIRLGLSESAALASLTTEPARVLGIEERVGTLEAGKAANLVVATGGLFELGTEIEEVWIDGVRFGDDPKRATESDLRGTWELAVGPGDGARSFRVELSRGKDALEGKTAPPERESGGDEEGGKDEGVELAAVELARGTLRFEHEGESFELRLDGKLLRGVARRGDAGQPVVGKRVRTPLDEPDDLWVVRSEAAPPWPPEADPSAAPRAVVVRNATIWTCGPAGRLAGSDLLVVDGEIRGVGAGLSAPADALVVDGTGLHVTPGLIDCHSHSSVSGPVNECTNSSTAEVRIGDVVNPRSRNIYRELAGGLTISNLLHGSCNAIGGQNAVIKLKWGRPASELLFGQAPPGIKFALGENVKQSNWGDEFTTRYPQTRMGVEQFYRDRFFAAEDYRREWDEWRRGKKKKAAPPRRDLGLDALVEVLDGDRLVHCHSYRSDEIIMMMRVAEDFGFRVATFQHVLEGYKCADEMAVHGAGASSFSDWWSYKYEVVDAIPYSGAIMWERGVNVSYNSDSSDVSRRMNLEGAKAAKYGGVPAEEAFDFVTRNPAIQLGIDRWVGSLEPGKHGDFVIWSDDPLSDRAICLETWIEGVRYFSREQDLSARPGMEELRAELLAKAGALRRIHELDTAYNDDEGSWPGRSAFGRKQGESAESERGVCGDHDEVESW